MTKKINIGLFIDTFYPMIDGVVQVVDNYARILAKNANVTVFAPAPRTKFDDTTLPYKVVRAKKLALPFIDYDLAMPQFDKKFKNELKNAKLDIIHIHSPFSIGKMGVQYAKKHNIPCVATMHSQYKQDFYKATKSNLLTNFLLKKIMKVFNSCDECWAVNEAVAKIFYYDYGAKILPNVQLNGSDMKAVINNKLINGLKNKYKIHDEKIFLFVGRLIELKNIFFIIDVLDYLNKKNFNFKMFFIGSGPDEEKLKEKINKLKLKDKVILTGKIYERERLAEFYKLADLFIFPSLYDTDGLVKIEAASQETPTILIRGATAASNIEDNKNGYIAENNIPNFSEKIISIFQDEKSYKDVCLNARKTIYLSWEDSVKIAYEKYIKIKERGNK